MALTSELSLEALLRRLLEAAAELTDARYAALGVIDPSGSQLERFLTHGIEPDAVAAIGELPRGRGILGVLLNDVESLRLHDLTDDPRSGGFPAGHPPMRTFLGVPIKLRGVAYGNLYLTEKAGGDDFTEQDEELVTLLASQAAIAIENVRLYESAMQWSHRLESLNEVGNALATETDLAALLDLVARRLHELLEARLVLVLLPQGGDELRIAAAAGSGTEELVGEVLARAGSKSGRVLDQRQSERIDVLLDDPEVDHETTRRFGARTGLWVPLLVHGRPIGVLAAHDKLSKGDGRFSDDDLRLAETYAARAAIAVDLSERVARDSLRRVVAAQELERRRLARELHDETGQALASILLGLKTLEREVGAEPLAVIRDLVASALGDVRRLTVELRPPALDDFGLAAALERLAGVVAERSGLDVDVNVGVAPGTLPPEHETAIYRIAQEALTNVVKHASAESISIVVTTADSMVRTVIEDDGVGFAFGAVRAEALGLVGMRERALLLGGRFDVESSPGAGTTIVAEIPLG